MSISYIINIKSRRKIYGIIGALITLVIPFFMMLHNENNHLETEQSFCPFKMLAGFPCPGCGITKSLVYFYQGDLYKSFSYHLFGPFVIVFSLITVVVLTIELFFKREYFNTILYNKKLAYGLAAFLMVYHIIRLIYFIKNNSIDDVLHQSIWR